MTDTPKPTTDSAPAPAATLAGRVLDRAVARALAKIRP